MTKPLTPRIHHGASGMAGPRERQTGCWVAGGGHIRSHDHEVLDRTRDDFLLMYVTAGAGYITSRGCRFPATPGQMLACFPHVPHSYGSDRTIGWDIRFVHFQGDVAQRLMGLTALRPDRPAVGNAIDQALLIRFEALLDTLRSGGPQAALQGCARLVDLLIDCVARLHVPEAEQNALLAAVSAAPGSVDDMAAAAGLSRYHFMRRFKEAMGISPWHYVTLLRMTRAKQLLTDSDWPIKRIARELGYGDPDYFSRLFKQEVGTSASQYRKQAMRIR